MIDFHDIRGRRIFIQKKDIIRVEIVKTNGKNHALVLSKGKEREERFGIDNPEDIDKLVRQMARKD